MPAHYWAGTGILPTKPWADFFPWYLEVPGLQEKIIAGMENTHYVVYRPPLSGEQFELGAYKPKLLTEYILKNFEQKKELSSGISLWERKE